MKPDAGKAAVETPPAAGRSAVVLLSGGLDSATAAAWARREGFRLAALSIDYGQRHRCELDSARAVAAALGIADHVILPVDLAAFGGSALVDPSVAVPKGRSAEAMTADIPVTYVPARNTVLLALALGLAEARGAAEVWIGVNAVDYSGYPDCRPAFVHAFQQLIDVATAATTTGGTITLRAPLIEWSKAEIIAEGDRLGVEFAATISCYDPVDSAACGTCDACRLRLAGFAAAGLIDPAPYARNA
jgi:7-cyano-7-deazaguanine synthase